MIHDICPTDLLVKERRGSLSAGERSRLRAHLATCESCRGWQRLGRDFAQVPESASHDTLIAERIIARALWSPEAQPYRAATSIGSRSRRRFGWFLLAALGSTAAAAAATWPMVSRRLDPPLVGHAIVRNPQTTSSAEPARSQTPKAADSPSISAALEPASASASPSTKAESAALPRTSRAVHSPTVTGETALTLYREANQARRRGEASRAIALFRLLQQTFPRSEESRLSHVALGSALLEAGQTRDSLRQYDRYLGTAGSRSLAAEAMYGRARALFAVGNREAERDAWQKLQAEYPSSPYDAQARRRLRALE